MSDQAPPSSDPADDDSLPGVLRTVFRKLMQQTDDLLPAIVVAFDRDTNRATVRPCVTALTSDGRAVPRAQVASVPVMQFGGGGVVLNFNLQPGNLGWIKAADRDISNFLQSYATTPPNTYRLHSFQDGIFIPDVMRGWTIAGEDDTAAVLQTLDGNTKIALDVDRLKLQSGASSVTLTPAGVTIDGPTVVIKGIVFESHVHGGVTPGGSSTSGPA